MLNILSAAIQIVIAVFTTPAPEPTEKFSWPNGKKAAICLTYDDGLSSQLSAALPMLNKYKIRASFYPTLASSSIYTEMQKWKKLANDGHELGNHAVYHPCQKSDKDMDWVKPYYNLDEYTLEELFDELKVANSFLKALDNKETRTYAYPCGHMHASGVNFKDSIKSIVTAARGASVEQVPLVNPNDIDLYNVTSWAPNGDTGEQLIAYVKQVLAKGTLSTFTFHGIGGDHMTISREAHQQLLIYLSSHSDEIWVTTFQEATNYLRLKQTGK